MLKKIEKPVPKFYEVPAPWNEMGFYLEIYDETINDKTCVEAWLCKEGIGIKSFLVGLPLEQGDKKYNKYEVLELIENMITFDYGTEIKYFLEQYVPEDVDKYYDTLEENGFPYNREIP